MSDDDDIRPFLFEGQTTIRAMCRNGVPWFVLVDLCRALGIVNARDAASGLDDDEKDVGSTDTLGGGKKLPL